MRSLRIKDVVLGGVSLVGLLWSGASSAQAAPARQREPAPNAADAAQVGSGPEAGEIIVTATKRTDTLQRVPFSIAATTAEQIRNSGASNVVELSRNVAGLFMADLGPGQSTVSIRGGSSGQVVRDESSRKAAVATYLDETDVSLALFTPDLDLFDLDRVEVLRGPQGTLFGAGAESGVVRYITAQPDLHRTLGQVEATVGSITDGGWNWNGKAALNVPVLDGRIAARAVGYYDHLGGFIDGIDRFGNVTKDVNRGKKYGGRLAVTFQPTETLTITPRIVYQRLDTDGFPRGEIYDLFRNPFTTTRPSGTFDGRQQERNVPEGLTDKFLLADVVANLDLGPVIATSISSYTHRTVDVRRDTTDGAVQINNVLIGLPDNGALTQSLLDQTRVNSYSQELRAASNGSGPLRYVLGGYYNRQNKSYGQTVVEAGFARTLFPSLTGAAAAPLGNDPDALFLSDFDIKFRQWALFGEASYDLLPTLTATAGVRYVDYRESRNTVISGFYNCGDSLTDCATPQDLRRRTTKDRAVNPRALLSYRPARDVTFNAQISKGLRLGGINDPLIAGLCQAETAALGGRDIERFKTEDVWNYEVGIKSQFLGRHLTVNASAYRTDISDLQVSVRLPCSSTIIANVPKARSQGLELELTASPSDSLTVGAGLSYNHSRVREGVSFLSVPGGANVSILKGDRLPASPAYSVNARFDYRRPVAGGTEAFVNGNVQLVSNSYSFLLDQRTGAPPVAIPIRYGRTSRLTVPFDTELSGYTLANMRIGVRRLGDWEVAVFVNNLFDTNAELSLDRERGGEARLSYLRNPPRTVGATVRKSF